MKQGDTVPVIIAGQVVAQATVKELSEGTATLVVPATLVVMATRTELTQEVKPEPAKDTIITGVDRTESAPVGNATGPEVHAEATPAEAVAEAKPAASDAPVAEVKENDGTQDNQSG